MATEAGPNARQRRIAAELRRLRHEAGLTQEAAATAAGMSRQKLAKLEGMFEKPTEELVESILGAYGGTDQGARLAILDLTRRSHERGWWVGFGETGPLVEFEDAADEMLILEVEMIPGLLQTKGYIHALLDEEPGSPEEIDRRVQTRLTRQTILARSTPPKLRVLITEEALRHQLGSPSVMAQQCDELLTAAALPNISIRVIPSSSGARPAIGRGSFVIFRFVSSVLNTLYADTVAGSSYVEEHVAVTQCTLTFESIAKQALSEEESAALIADIANEYREQSSP